MTRKNKLGIREEISSPDPVPANKASKFWIIILTIVGLLYLALTMFCPRFLMFFAKRESLWLTIWLSYGVAFFSYAYFVFQKNAQLDEAKIEYLDAYRDDHKERIWREKRINLICDKIENQNLCLRRNTILASLTTIGTIIKLFLH